CWRPPLNRETPMTTHDIRAADQRTRNRRLKIAFERCTPEAIEEGGAAERGWIGEEGISMDPDEFDLEEGPAAVVWAAQCPHAAGAEPSASHGWHQGLWYTDRDAEQDPHTGEYTLQSYHPAGFTDEEQAQLVERVRELNREQIQKMRRGRRQGL